METITKIGVDGTKYYINKDNPCEVIDIDVPDNVTTFYFRYSYTEEEAFAGTAFMSSYNLRDVHKQFKNISKIYIADGVTDINISNFMFPNVTSVSGNYYKVNGFKGSNNGYLIKIDSNRETHLLNTFCLTSEDSIDLRNIDFVEPFAFEGSQCTRFLGCSSRTTFCKDWHKGSMLQLKENDGVIYADNAIILLDKNIETVDLKDDYPYVFNASKDKVYIHSLNIYPESLDYKFDRTDIHIDILKFCEMRNIEKCHLFNVACSAFEIDASNKYHKIVDGILYNHDVSLLIACPKHKTGKIVIPEGVVEIAANAFWGCDMIDSVEFPESLHILGSHSFSCSAIREIKFANGLRAIGADNCTHIFEHCKKLETVEIPEGVEIISPYAFSNCKNLKSVSLPSTLRDIKNYAFSGCDKLKSIIIPVSVLHCGSCAFSSCDEIKLENRLMLWPDFMESISYSFIDADAVPESLGFKTAKVSMLNDKEKQKEIFLPGAYCSKNHRLGVHLTPYTDEFFTDETQMRIVEIADEVKVSSYIMRLRLVLQHKADDETTASVRKRGKKIAGLLFRYKKTDELIEMLKLNLLSKKAMNELLEKAQEKGDTVVSGYLLSVLSNKKNNLSRSFSL